MAKVPYLGSTLPLKRNNRGYFQTTSDPFENEKSKLINLILTKKGERVANPDFGCDLWRLLFEPKNENTKQKARQYVINAVNTFMPYLVLQEFLIVNEETFQEDNYINLYVKYGFANNPLVTDELQILLGQTPAGGLTQSGRITSRTEVPGGIPVTTRPPRPTTPWWVSTPSQPN